MGVVAMGHKLESRNATIRNNLTREKIRIRERTNLCYISRVRVRVNISSLLCVCGSVYVYAVQCSAAKQTIGSLNHIVLKKKAVDNVVQHSNTELMIKCHQCRYWTCLLHHFLVNLLWMGTHLNPA